MILRLIADDLTGALDAAAPFASPEAAVRLVFKQTSAVTGDKLTFSTESRDVSVEEAAGRAERAFAAMRTEAGAIWFKKVDSVLRGHPFAEISAFARAGNFGHCLFAPAFPEMGRITRGGRQFVRGPDGALRATGPNDLRGAFSELDAAGIGLTVLDAETPEELRERIAPYRTMKDLLWAGSGGLARALMPEVAHLVAPAVAVFLIGTSHPVTRVQTALLQGHTKPAVRGGLAAEDTMPVLVDPVPYCADANATAAALVAAIARIGRPAGDRALVVSGGDCLSLLLRETSAEGLDCIGEVGIGLPLSRIVGGRLSGVQVISKSGGFGSTETLRDLAVNR